MLFIPLFMILFHLSLIQSLAATGFITLLCAPIDIVAIALICKPKSVGGINDLIYTGVCYTENSPVYYKDALPRLFGHRNNFYMVPAKPAYQGKQYPYCINTIWLYSSIEKAIYYIGPSVLQSDEIPEKYDALTIATKSGGVDFYRLVKVTDPHALSIQGFAITLDTTEYYLHQGSLLQYKKYVSILWDSLCIENQNRVIHDNTKRMMERQYGKRTIDLALLTPSVYWFAKLMNSDIGVAKSMVLRCIKEGQNVAYNLKDHLGDLTPDWEYLKSLLDNEPDDVWWSRVNDWQTAITDTWYMVSDFFQDRRYHQMIAAVDRSLEKISKQKAVAKECDRIVGLELEQRSSTKSAFLELVDTVQKKINETKPKPKSKSALEYERIYKQYLDVCHKLDHTSSMRSIDIYRLKQTKKALENMLRQMIALGKDK